MDTSELLKRVRKVEIKTKGLSRHIFSGEYHSAFKGRGMSFSEVRNYQYGDDIRNIDWNVTARTNEAHVKVFEEERELTVMLVVDVSASSFFGTEQALKSELITELCAVLAFSAIQNNDKVGLIMFSDQVELYIPAKKGKSHILRIIRELINVEASGSETNVDEALRYLTNVNKKRSICFVLSDFICSDFETPLRVAARKHDLIGVHIYDKAEYDLPKVGLLKVVDPESGKKAWLDTNDSKMMAHYRQAYQQNENRFKDLFYRSGADILQLQTGKEYVSALHQFFKRRSS